MIKKIVTIICSLQFLLVQASSQDSLSLSDIHAVIETGHPFGLKPDVYKRIYQLNRKVSDANYLPKLVLNASATYQSDVIDLDIPIPGVELPSQSHDQYGVSVDISQIIYDGGTTKAYKDLLQAQLNTQLQQVAVEMYQVKKQANQLYFSILILERNKATIQLSLDNLEGRIAFVRKQVENGVLLKTHLLVLKSQKLKLEQSSDELASVLLASREALGILIHKPADGVLVAKPDAFIEKVAVRPELKLFENQKEQFENAVRLQKRENMPTLVGFGQAGYGKPGLNMLNDAFDSYYLLGVKLSWSIWDWQKVKHQAQVYHVQQDLVRVGEKAFQQGRQTELAKVDHTILQLELAITKDEKLLALQKEILESYTSQLENGVITSTDYANQLNEVLLAEIMLNTHKIKLIQAQTDKRYL